MRLKLLLTSVFGVTFIIGVCLLVSFHQSTTVVSIDIKKIKAEFIKQLAESKANKVQIQQASIRFKGAFKASINAYATSHRAVILNQSAVVSGTSDVTTQLMAEIAREMGGGA